MYDSAIFPFLAHGALGIWDEVIFISLAAIFLAMMGISWLRSRMDPLETLDDAPPSPAPESETPAPERFRLD